MKNFKKYFSYMFSIVVYGIAATLLIFALARMMKSLILFFN